SPCWHRPDDAGPGPLRSDRRGLRSPQETPRPRLPIQSRTLRQKAAGTTAQTNRGLDQPANPKARNPSLNSNAGCLKVVDTFRIVERLQHQSLEDHDFIPRLASRQTLARRIARAKLALDQR